MAENGEQQNPGGTTTPGRISGNAIMFYEPKKEEAEFTVRIMMALIWVNGELLRIRQVSIIGAVTLGRILKIQAACCIWVRKVILMRSLGRNG